MSLTRLLLTSATIWMLSAPAVPAAQPAGGKPVIFDEKIVILGPGECRLCHERQADVWLSSPTLHLEFDLHAKNGIGCADCHGGNPRVVDQDEAHSQDAGYLGKIDVQAIPELCARCHSNPGFMVTYNPRLGVDQYEKYQTSRHGELLQMGLRKVATCSSCHTSHNVRVASDPRSSTYAINLPRTCAHCHSDGEYMAGFPIPTDQFEKFAVSVHGQALLEREDVGAPACNDCHGNHGAVPPGAQSLAHVCGTCHALNMELFEKSPHVEPFGLQELPQCTVCHNHHAIPAPTPRTLNMEADSVCIKCHKQNDPGWREGKTMYKTVAELDETHTQTEALLDAAQSLGMDVADGRFLLRDYRSSYFQLRTLSHEFDLEAWQKKAEEARKQLQDAIAIADGAIYEFHFRRKGLMVSVLLAMPVLLLLYLKIRSLDRRGKSRG